MERYFLRSITFLRNLLFIIIVGVELFSCVRLAHAASFNDSVLIGGSGPADSKAQLEVKSTTKGILFPRMTTTERDAISSPTTSLIIFNTTNDVFEFWDGAQWTAIGSGAGNITGPATSTVGAVALWDATDGTVLKNSSVTISGSAITGSLSGNSSTATALASNPTDCASDRYATTIDASGNLTCAQVTSAGLAGSIALNKLAALGTASIPYTDGSGFLTTTTAPAYDSTNKLITVTGDTSGISMTSSTDTTASGSLKLDHNSTSLLLGTSESSTNAGYSLGLSTANIAGSNANATGGISLTTGNKTAGTGSSGGITIQTGTSVGGTRGRINLVDGTEGTAGMLWTSANNAGGGHWRVPPNSYQNFLFNPGFEETTTGWTASGGTLSTASSGSNFQGIGLLSGTWDSSSASQTLTGTAYTIGNGLAGTNGLMRCKVMTPSGTATHTFGTWDGTTLSNTITVPSSTTAQYVEIAFPFGAAGTTIAPRFTSVASNEPLISIDDCYIGTDFQISGQTPITEWVSYTPTYSNMGSPATDTAEWRRVGSDMELRGRFTAGTGSASAAAISLPSGYSWSNPTTSGLYVGAASSNASSNYDQWIFTASGATTGSTLNFFYAEAVLGSATNGSSFNSSVIVWHAKVKILGWTSQTAVRVDNSDFDWRAFTPTGTWSTNTTYSGRYRKIGDSAEIEVKVSTSGAPTSAALSINMPNGLVVDTSKLASATAGDVYVGVGNATDNGVAAYPCWVYQASSGTVLTPTFGVASGANLTSGSNVTQAAPFTFGSGDFVTIRAKVPIVGWTNNQRAPLLVGSVTSNTAGLERIERVRVGTTCTSTPCTISDQSGSWVTSITRASTGNYTINIASGMFSGTPICTFGMSGITNATIVVNSESSTAINILTYTGSTGALTDTSFRVICMGPR